MPPRKSDVAKAAIADEGTLAKDQLVGINLEDLNLPKSIVTRLAKGVLPPNTQIQGNAMLAMTKSATVFVNYLASHANEYAQRENRKTLAPQDVFRALEELEFPDFKPRLEAELARYNDIQTDKRNTSRNKAAASKAQGKADDDHDGEGEGESRMEADGQPAAKKARRDLDDSMGDASELHESHNTDDHTADEGEDEEAQAGEDEDDEDEGDEEERLDPEEHPEDLEEQEAEDEALDNGEDSE